MTHHEPAKQWVEAAWRSDFRYGIVTYDPPQRNPDAYSEVWNEDIEEDFRLHDVAERVMDLLELGKSARQARTMVARMRLEGRMFISTTKEELIDSIAALLARGASCKGDPAVFAWVSDGIFRANFSHEQ